MIDTEQQMYDNLVEQLIADLKNGSRADAAKTLAIVREPCENNFKLIGLMFSKSVRLRFEALKREHNFYVAALVGCPIAQNFLLEEISAELSAFTPNESSLPERTAGDFTKIIRLEGIMEELRRRLVKLYFAGKPRAKLALTDAIARVFPDAANTSEPQGAEGRTDE